MGIDELRKDRTVRESRGRHSSKRGRRDKKRKRRRAGRDDDKRRERLRDGGRKRRSSRRARDAGTGGGSDGSGSSEARRKGSPQGGGRSSATANGSAPRDAPPDGGAAAAGTNSAEVAASTDSPLRNNRAHPGPGGEEEGGGIDESDTESSDSGTPRSGPAPRGSAYSVARRADSRPRGHQGPVMRHPCPRSGRRTFANCSPWSATIPGSGSDSTGPRTPDLACSFARCGCVLRRWPAADTREHPRPSAGGWRFAHCATHTRVLLFSGALPGAGIQLPVRPRGAAVLGQGVSGAARGGGDA